jgi:outer membrane receptor protein involved in Fe transport
MKKLKNKKYMMLLTLGLIPAISAATVSADELLDLSFEELLNVEISSASKYLQTVKAAPSAVKVITSADIRRYGWRNLDQALATLPGLSFSSDGSYSYLGARGLSIPGDYNTRVLLLVDGVPFNDAIYGQATIENSFPIDLSLIDKIEYVPGPGSAIYGSHAMFGVINVFTKTGSGQTHHVELAADADTEQRKTLRFNYSNEFANGANVLLAGKRMRRSGQDSNYPEGVVNELTDADGEIITSGKVNDRDKADDKELFAKLSAGDLTLTFFHGDRTSEPSVPLYWTNFNDDGLFNRDRYTNLGASYNAQLSEGVEWFNSINYQDSYYTGEFPYSYGEDEDNPRVVNRDETEAHRWIVESRLTFTNWQDHVVVAGMEARKEGKTRVTNFDLGDGEADYEYFAHNVKDHSLAFYLQDDWQFAESWRLNVGARMDDSKLNGSHVSPRLALIWQATPELTVKAISGKAFRSPVQYESTYGLDASLQDDDETEEYLNNPSLKEESITTNELVFHWQPSHDFEWVNSFYHYKLTDLIGQVETESEDLQYQHIGDIKAYGVESSMKYLLQNDWKISANVNIQHSEDDSGKRLAVSPVWNAKVLLDGPIINDSLYLAWETHASDGYDQEWFGETFNFSSNVVSNLALTAVTPVKGLDVQLRLNNVFDRDFDTANSSDSPIVRMPDAGINARITVRYNF